MRQYSLGHVMSLLFGFLLGAALAISIAPGDVLLWLATGIVLGVFSHAFFQRSFGGEFSWRSPAHSGGNADKRSPHERVTTPRHTDGLRGFMPPPSSRGRSTTTYPWQSKKHSKQQLRQMNRQASHPQTGRPNQHQEHPCRVF